ALGGSRGPEKGGEPLRKIGVRARFFAAPLTRGEASSLYASGGLALRMRAASGQPRRTPAVDRWRSAEVHTAFGIMPCIAGRTERKTASLGGFVQAGSA